MPLPSFDGLPSTLNKKVITTAIILTCTGAACVWYYLKSNKASKRPVSSNTAPILRLPESSDVDDEQFESQIQLQLSLNVQFESQIQIKIGLAQLIKKLNIKSIDGLGKFPVVVFIHGFNNNDTAVYDRSVKIDTTHNITIPYDWKSTETLSGYTKDQTIAKRHAGIIVQYLNELLKLMNELKMHRLYIVCHSMGNYILYNCLKYYVFENDKYNFTFKKFNRSTQCEVIAVAADCPQDEYTSLVEGIMQTDNVNKYGITKWTHYYNENDRALWFSRHFEHSSLSTALKTVKKWIFGGNDEDNEKPWKGVAGKCAIDIKNNSNVISIDCSAFSGLFLTTNHSYIQRDEVANDIKQLIQGIDCSKRKGLTQDKTKRNVYKLK